MRVLVASIAFLLVAGMVAGSNEVRVKPTEPGVATVGHSVISAEVFRARYTEYLRKTGTPDQFRLRLFFVNYLVDVNLVEQAMREEGIEQEEAYRFERDVLQRKLLLDAYADRMLFDTLAVTDADLRAMFVRVNTRLKARHLYARTRAQADALYARLQRGERFEDLAREVFADPELAERGGSVGYFGFDEMDPAFEDAAFDLEVGAISEPVRTAFGYSIVQLEDRQTHPLLTETDFTAKKKQLKTYVLRRKRTEALFQHSRHLEEALAITYDDETLARLLAQISGTALAPDDETAWLEAPLVRFGSGRTWTVADFRERARYTAPEQRAKVTSLEHLKAFIAGLVVREEMLARARAAELHRLPAYRQALDRAMAQWLYQTAQDRIGAGVEVPEDSLRAHFEAHRASYTIPEQVQVAEILVADKATAARLKAALAHTSFDALARAHSLRPGADATGGDLGYVSREQLGRLAGPVFDAAEGAVVGPLEVAGRYVLLHVGPRRAARAATFDEVRSTVRDELHERYAQRRFRDYLDTLRTRYAVTIDEAALAAVSVPL